MGDAHRRDVLLRRHATERGRLTRPAQAGAVSPTAHRDRRARQRRTPALAARYADEFNVPFASAEQNRTLFAQVDAAAEAIDRDPASIIRSAALVLCCGADEAEVARRAAAIGREPDELRINGLAGTPQEIIGTLGAYAAAGVERVYLQVLDLGDLDHLELVAQEVMPHA